jgi:hypothetical protein
MLQVQSLHDLESCSVTTEPGSMSIEEQPPFASLPRLGRTAQSTQNTFEMTPTDMNEKPGKGALLGPLSPFGDVDSSRSRSRPHRKSYDSIREAQSSTCNEMSIPGSC